MTRMEPLKILALVGSPRNEESYTYKGYAINRKEDEYPRAGRG